VPGAGGASGLVVAPPQKPVDLHRPCPHHVSKFEWYLFFQHVGQDVVFPLSGKITATMMLNTGPKMYVAGTALLTDSQYHFVVQPSSDMLLVNSPTCVLGWNVRSVKEKRSKDGTVFKPTPTMLTRIATKGFKMGDVLFELKLRVLHINPDAFYEGEVAGGDLDADLGKRWCGPPVEGEDAICLELTRDAWPHEVKAGKNKNEDLEDDAGKGDVFGMPYKVWKQAAKHVLS
jgi:hypothetical protein